MPLSDPLLRDNILAFFRDLTLLCQKHQVYLGPGGRFEIWPPGDRDPRGFAPDWGWRFEATSGGCSLRNDAGCKECVEYSVS